MARTAKVKIGGKSLTIKATWDAGVEISEEICDLYKISAEVRRTAIYDRMGRAHKPEFEFTMANVAEIVIIAVRTSGYDMDDAKIHEWMMDVGLTEAVTFAQEYLMLFYGAPEKQPEGEAKEKGEASGK